MPGVNAERRSQNPPGVVAQPCRTTCTVCGHTPSQDRFAEFCERRSVQHAARACQQTAVNEISPLARRGALPGLPPVRERRGGGVNIRVAHGKEQIAPSTAHCASPRCFRAGGNPERATAWRRHTANSGQQYFTVGTPWRLAWAPACAGGRRGGGPHTRVAYSDGADCIIQLPVGGIRCPSRFTLPCLRAICRAPPRRFRADGNPGGGHLCCR